MRSNPPARPNGKTYVLTTKGQNTGARASTEPFSQITGSFLRLRIETGCFSVSFSAGETSRSSATAKARAVISNEEPVLSPASVTADKSPGQPIDIGQIHRSRR